MLGPELFSAVACSAMPLQLFGTHYLLISLIILTACFYLVLSAASKRISTNFHSRPSHKRCWCLRFLSLNWHMTGHQLRDWLIDWLKVRRQWWVTLQCRFESCIIGDPIERSWWEINCRTEIQILTVIIHCSFRFKPRQVLLYRLCINVSWFYMLSNNAR